MRISSLMNGPGPTSYLVPGARVGPSWSRDETMEQEPAYLVRYGLMGHVGRFPLDLGTRLDARIERGQTVVILTDRGVELGEVLVSPASLAANSGAVGGVRSVVLDGSLIDTSKAELDQDPGRPRLLRVAVAADIQDARRSDGLRADRFTLCQRILDEGGWSIDLLDVEPLLDPGTTVLHILGPLDLNLAEIRSAFRSRSDFDVLFELAGSSSGLARVGIEAPEHPASSQEPIRRCGDCDCSDGGCGSTATAREVSSAAVATAKHDPPASCGVSSSHGGCASCGVSKWVASQRGEKG